MALCGIGKATLLLNRKYVLRHISVKNFRVDLTLPE